MNRTVKSYGLLTLLIILVSIGVALMVKTDTGLGPWDAMALTFSFLTGMKIGTIGMICNFLCIFGQIALLGKNFKKINFLQIPISILLGSTVNFFLYTVFKNLTFESYLSRIGVAIISIVFITFLVGAIVCLGLPTFSLEGFCSAVHQKTGIPFAKFRQWVDFFCVGLIIILTLIFPIKWSLREGTIICMLIFGPLLGIFMPIIERMYEKLGLTEGKSEMEKEFEGLE